jgi:hypothetical protein
MPFLRTLISHPLEREPGSPTRSRPGLLIQAQTLGEAVAVAASHFGVRILLHDPPKWFRVYGALDQPGDFYRLVDIHIRRGSELLCPKQDLSYPLLESDTIEIGTLAC